MRRAENAIWHWAKLRVASCNEVGVDVKVQTRRGKTFQDPMLSEISVPLFKRQTEGEISGFVQICER